MQGFYVSRACCHEITFIAGKSNIVMSVSHMLNKIFLSWCFVITVFAIILNTFMYSVYVGFKTSFGGTGVVTWITFVTNPFMNRLDVSFKIFKLFITMFTLLVSNKYSFMNLLYYVFVNDVFALLDNHTNHTDTLYEDACFRNVSSCCCYRKMFVHIRDTLWIC